MYDNPVIYNFCKGIKVSKTHKVSAPVAAVAQAFRSPAQIAADGRGRYHAGPARGHATTDTKKANDQANYNAGAGAAEAFITLVKSQGVSLKGYLQRIAETDQQWRKGFRVALEKARDDMHAHVKAREGKADLPVYEQALRSAMPRFSEAIGFSKAIDAGFVPDMSQGYHALIGAANAFRRSQSAAAGTDEASASGPTVRKSRGRKATPVLDKVKNYLLSLSLTVEQLEDVGKMVATLTAVAKAQQSAPL